MCECGCGGGVYSWRMPGPDGKWYVLGVYDSCLDCDTPAGLDIALADDEDMELFDYKSLPEIDIKQPMIGIAVLHWRVLKKHIKNFFIGTDDMPDDLASDMLKETFRSAVHDTIKQYKPAIKRRRRRR